ncbi:MAG: c-type cytochrome [Proteobacteria bacterium]|nr:c-type cytochrome [Pseudomonadota bacterium]
MKLKRIAAAVLIMSAAAEVCGEVKPTIAASTATASQWIVPDIDKLPDDNWGRTVRYGRDLIAKTASLIGPEVKDPARRFAGNNLNCQSCHINAGTQEYGIPFIGVFADFPKYRARSGAVGTIEDRLQGCMERSMNGKPLPANGPEMIAIVSYMKFLSTGRPIGEPTPGRRAGAMPELDRAADPVRGRKIFENNCAACHGADGLGQRVGSIGDAKGYVFPPLWGPDSFNDGAGMNTLIDAANFIHSNMPQGTTWQSPSLSPEDAWDVAAYIESQPRPKKANLEKDFPNKLEKPVDEPYGPFADDFSLEQHKFGPFAPIRAAVKKLRQKQRGQ